MEKLISLFPDWDFLLSYDGKVSRRDYWIKGQLFFFAISFFLSLFNMPSLSIIFFVVSLYSYTVISIKRAHDVGLSGHFVWLSIVPVANFWLFFKLGFCKSVDSKKTLAQMQ